MQPDGKILAGLGLNIVRLNPDGTRDMTFNAPLPNSGIAGFTLQSDGKVIVGGNFTTLGGVARRGVARLNTDGTLDPTFDVGVGSTDVVAVAILSDGKILVGGIFNQFNLAPNTEYVARLNSNGSVDTTFVKGTNVSTTYAVVVQPDGKILMGGLGGQSVARLNADGTTDNTFSCNLGAPTLTLALQPDGKIIAGGGFNNAGSQPVFKITRLNADGSLDSSFNTGSGPDAGVQAVRVQPDGKVLIAGDFVSFNGTSRVNLARLNSDGSLDNTFNANLTGSLGSNFIHSMSFLPDGKVIVGGVFTASGSGINRQHLARLNGDLFATWNDGDSADKVISLPVVDDLIDEPDESLNLSLSSIQGGALAGAIPNATITIVDNDVPPTINSGAPPQGTTRVPYSHTFTATGVPAAMAFNLQSGSLPPGLFLQSSGVLSGTPTTAGTFTNIVISASNGVAPAGTQSVSIVILSGGTLQFSSSTFSVAENAGTALITVERAGGSAGTTAVNYSTSPGSASANGDFTTTSGTLTFGPGETSKTFTVAITNDTTDEADETINMGLSSVTGTGSLGTPSLASLTILDDDPPPSLAINDVTVVEGNAGTRSVSFTITSSAPSALNITVNVTAVDGTATMGSDYSAPLPTATINAGTTSRSVSVLILSDAVSEPDETLFINISNPQNATITRPQGKAIIINDDAPGANPIDLPGYDVRQNYADFLNREPDVSGFEFWRNDLTGCGSDAACTEVKRINVSAAFYLSIEFQETGYLVERLYKVAYDDAFGSSTLGGFHQLFVPIVRRNEFVPDSQQISAGVIVGETGWETLLESRKQAFILQFVQRARFVSAFPTFLAPAEFVDRLNVNAGNVLSPGERATAIGLFGSATNTSSASARAQVLRQIAEDQDLYKNEFNRAFVLMQFFGYLRRNPNDLPDLDYTGYDFWLSKLNQFNGNFVNAEMVKAFIFSGEYRQRFGP